MGTPFRQLFKSYFNFSRKDRNAVITLCILIFIVLAGHIVIDRIELKPGRRFAELKAILEEWENETSGTEANPTLFEFDPNTISEKRLDSLAIPSFIKRNILSYRSAGGKFSRLPDVRKIYGMNDSIFSVIEPYIFIPKPKPVSKAIDKKPEKQILSNAVFDPNLVSVNELMHLGFSRFQASNLAKYRQSGGCFSQPEDLLKIYGIDSVFFASVQNRIQIEEVPPEDIARQKLTNTLMVELNSADSITLDSLYGIGPVFASRIIKYRELLGGFYSTRQLLEVYGFPEETFQSIRENIQVDTVQVKKLRVNFTGYPELIRHPYIKQKHAEAILEYRRKNGPFISNDQIIRAGLIDSSAFIALKPYLTCR